MLSPIVKRIAGSSSDVARDPCRTDIQSYGDGPKWRAGNDHVPQGDGRRYCRRRPGFSSAVALYMFALPGFSSARPQPPGVEVAVATWLLRHSVPATARQQHNPLGADAADAAAGRDLFRQNCEICHGYWRWQDADRWWRISASTRSAVAHRVDDRWRGFLSHTQRHPEHRHAGLDPAGPAGLAARPLHAESAEDRVDVRGPRRRPAGRPRGGLALRRIRVLQVVPFQHLRPLEEDADGQRRA